MAKASSVKTAPIRPFAASTIVPASFATVAAARARSSVAAFACAPKLPLTTWFLALHLLTVSRPVCRPWSCIASFQLPRAWMVAKLLQAMKEADDQGILCGIIQLDDETTGAAERRGGKREWGGRQDTFCSGSCSERSWTPDSHAHDGRFWFQNQRDKVLRLSATWGREVWSSLTASNAFERLSAPLANHLGFTMGGRLELLDHAAFRWVNTMLGNIKTSASRELP